MTGRKRLPFAEGRVGLAPVSQAGRRMAVECLDLPSAGGGIPPGWITGRSEEPCRVGRGRSAIPCRQILPVRNPSPGGAMRVVPGCRAGLADGCPASNRERLRPGTGRMHRWRFGAKGQGLASGRTPSVGGPPQGSSPAMARRCPAGGLSVPPCSRRFLQPPVDGRCFRDLPGDGDAHRRAARRNGRRSTAGCVRRRFGYWKATSAKLRSLRLCSWSTPWSRSNSIARMPMRRCWSTRSR
jgi:hypothetical protein